MKTTLVLMAIAASLALAACGSKSDESAAPGAAQPAAAVAAPKAEDAPREATYDANLKPATIVWDSPEKQKAWEARQAELRQKPSAPAQ